MINTAAFLLALWTLGPAGFRSTQVLSGSEASGVSPCPVVHGRAAAPIIWAIKHKGFSELNRPDLLGFTQRELVPLVDQTVCSRLDHFYSGSTFDDEGWRREYLKLGTYYIGSIFHPGKSRNDVKRGHMAVFDVSMRLLGVVDNMP